MSESTFTRRDFLRVAAGAAAVAATGTACGSGSDKPKPSEAAAKGGASKARKTLRIALIAHYVPAYDVWFDREYTTRWGDEHDVDVVVDHHYAGTLNARAASEVASRRGHDIFGFYTPPAAFEDDVIDHREVVEEVQAKVGPMLPLAERSTFNPKTGKWYGFPDYLNAFVVNYRTDLWSGIASSARPDTWDDLLAAGPNLKAAGHPLGIDMSQDLDGNTNLFSLLHAYGASVQDENSAVVINRPATVEAVKAGTAIYRTGMTDEVLAWDDPTGNNRYLASGKGSLILNQVSAIRAIEKQDAGLAAKVGLAPALAGPAGRLGVGLTTVLVIWRFAENQETAKQFLVDLASAYRDPFLRSEFYNLPAFPGALPDLGQLLSHDAHGNPPDKYAVLAGTADWSANLGHPGHANGAIDEVLTKFIVPKMFNVAARGEMSAEEAVRAAEAEITSIFEKWRKQGKI